MPIALYMASNALPSDLRTMELGPMRQDAFSQLLDPGEGLQMQGSSDGYESLEQKPYESFYMYVDTIIDHPVEKVWPHALNIGSWMSDHRLETIAGESGKVGHFERVFPHGLGQEVPLPHHHLYGVAEIIPLKLIVLEVFREKGGSYGKTREKVSFDNILLSDIDSGRTKVAYLMVDLHMGKGDKDFPMLRKRELEGVRSMIKRYFENLRRLAGTGS